MSLLFSDSSFVFLSHSSRDKIVVHQVAVGLVAHGVSVWFDEWDIPLGGSIPEHVGEGIGKATHLLLFWSAEAARSPWVRREQNSFLHQAIGEGKSVIVISLDETPVPALVADLRGIRSRSVPAILDQLMGPGRDERQIRSAIVGLGARLKDLLQRDVGNGYERCPECGSNKILERSIPYGYDDLATFTVCSDCGADLGHCV